MTHAFCNIEASIKRSPEGIGGIITDPVTHIASIQITNVLPITTASSISERFFDLTSLREAKECYHVPDTLTLPDIAEGDLLVVGSKEYPITAVLEWGDFDIPFLQIIVQEVKQ